jgi:hypothetical protein
VVCGVFIRRSIIVAATVLAVQKYPVPPFVHSQLGYCREERAKTRLLVPGLSRVLETAEVLAMLAA